MPNKVNSNESGRLRAEDVHEVLDGAAQEYRQRADEYMQTTRVPRSIMKDVSRKYGKGRKLDETQQDLFEGKIAIVSELVGILWKLKRQNKVQEMEALLAEQFANNLRRLLDILPADIYLFMSFEKNMPWARRIDDICDFIKQVLTWDIKLPGYVRYDFVVIVATLQAKKEVPDDSRPDSRKFHVLSPDRASTRYTRERIFALVDGQEDQKVREANVIHLRELFRQIIEGYYVNNWELMFKYRDDAIAFAVETFAVSREDMMGVFADFGYGKVGKNLLNLQTELDQEGVFDLNPEEVFRYIDTCDDLLKRLTAIIGYFGKLLQEREMSAVFQQNDNLDQMLELWLKTNTCEVIQRLFVNIDMLLKMSQNNQGDAMLFTVPGLGQFAQTALERASYICRSISDYTKKRIDQGTQSNMMKLSSMLLGLQGQIRTCESLRTEFVQAKQRFESRLEGSLEALLLSK